MGLCCLDYSYNKARVSQGTSFDRSVVVGSIYHAYPFFKTQCKKSAGHLWTEAQPKVEGEGHGKAANKEYVDQGGGTLALPAQEEESRVDYSKTASLGSRGVQGQCHIC